MTSTHEDIEKLISVIATLTQSLPHDALPLGSTEDLLWKTFTEVEGESPWQTFNRRFDITLGEDCRNEAGRLLHLRQGRYGLDLVLKYIRSVYKCEGMLLDLMKVKLDRLVVELRFLVKESLKPPKKAKAAPVKAKAPSGSVQTANGQQPSESGVATRPKDKTVVSKTKPTPKPKAPKPKKQLPLDIVKNGQKEICLLDDVETDKDYRPPKHTTDARSPSPTAVFDERGDEILENVAIERKEKSGLIVTIADTASSGDELDAQLTKPLSEQPSVEGTKKARRRSSSGKYKPPPKKAKTSHGTAGPSKKDIVDISDEAESDGETALRAVEEREAKASGGRRGPRNETLKHWHAPTPIRDPKHGARWEFKCRHCSSVRTVPRTIDVKNPQWEMEPRKPQLGNLATHISRDHSDVSKGTTPPDDEPSSVDHGYTLASAKMMEAYLKEGALNPALVPTQKGFLRLFAAWILDEDLPFTTGEAPSLKRLFQYLKINFVLPTDTTVRNCLAEIFMELHGKVVRELTTVKSRIAYSTDTWSMKQMIFTFAGTIASFIDDDWKLVERLVDFHHLKSNEHKGEHAAKAFVHSAARRGGHPLAQV